MKYQIRFTHREYIGTEFETQFQSVLPYGQNSATVLFTVQCNPQCEHSSVSILWPGESKQQERSQLSTAKDSSYKRKLEFKKYPGINFDFNFFSQPPA